MLKKLVRLLNWLNDIYMLLECEVNFICVFVYKNVY